MEWGILKTLIILSTTNFICFKQCRCLPANIELNNTLIPSSQPSNGNREVMLELDLSKIPTSGLESDVTGEFWSPGLSPKANLKRFKAIRAGLLQNLNESVIELTTAIKKKDAREAQYLLNKLNEKWRKLEDLQKNIIQLIPDDDLDILTEETRLFEENRDVVDRQIEEAREFLTQGIRIESSDFQSYLKVR